MSKKAKSTYPAVSVMTWKHTEKRFTQIRIQIADTERDLRSLIRQGLDRFDQRLREQDSQVREALKQMNARMDELSHVVVKRSVIDFSRPDHVPPATAPPATAPPKSMPMLPPRIGETWTFPAYAKPNDDCAITTDLYMWDGTGWKIARLDRDGVVISGTSYLELDDIVRHPRDISPRYVKKLFVGSPSDDDLDYHY